MVVVFSSEMASLASRSLREYPSMPSDSVAAAIASASPLRTAVSSRTFFTYCCVSVEAPWVASLEAFFTAARSMPVGSIPPCSKNRLSSVATTASRITGAIRSSGTTMRSSA